MSMIKTQNLIFEYEKRDEEGNIEKIMPKVKPDTNAADILAYLTGDHS